MTESPSGFSRLDRRLQRWIWKERWDELREIQELAIPVILPAVEDVLLAASTAAGKTEAAYLPALSRVVSTAERPGIRILNLAPLKALINDQFDRLELLAAEVDVPVHRWHGDVSQAAKKRLLDHPAGVLLITPESLEATFVLRGTRVPRLFSGLEFVIVDELHAFLGTERGRQLQCLMHRLEAAVGRRIPRIGLSATLGDLGLAAEALRPGEGERVRICQSKTIAPSPRISVLGFRERRYNDPADEHSEVSALRAISQDVFEHTRTGHHLVFAGARGMVEEFTDLLRDESRRRRFAEIHYPHHGNLSKEIREAAERALKDPTRPATAVATSTLELGIDIGSLESVLQIGSAPAVASLRQRMGRSGRSGRKEEPPILRLYVLESALDSKIDFLPTLRLDLLEAIAQIDLLLEGWCEPPEPQALHLSTLVQQILSMIAQLGGAMPEDIHRTLCQTGPFRPVTKKLLALVIRSLGKADWLMQDPTGLLLPGLKGEKILAHYDFYSAFLTSIEYLVSEGSHKLGTVPLDPYLVEGGLLIFAGRRWKILRIDHESKRIDVTRSSGGRVPLFAGRNPVSTHDVVRQRMLRIYGETRVPEYLDETAASLLAEGRSAWARAGLADETLIEVDGKLFGFPWMGDRAVSTLLFALRATGIEAEAEAGGAVLSFPRTVPSSLQAALDRFLANTPDAIALAEVASPGPSEKFHPPLSEELLSLDWAATAVDLAGARIAARQLLRRLSKPN